jgi:hypothetical protein
MNTSHYCCYCGAVNFLDLLPFNGSLVHTSENRVRGKRQQCHSCHFYTFRQMTGAVVFPLSFVHRILYSGRETDRGNTLLRPPCSLTMWKKSRLIDRPPEWPLVKLSRLLCRCPSILVACSQLIQCACRMAGLLALAVARIRKYTLKVWWRKKFAQLSLYVSRRHSESGDVEVHLQPFLTVVLGLDEWSA